MKRILLFLLTNVAVMVVLSFFVSVLGLNRFLTEQGLNLGMLLAEQGRLPEAEARFAAAVAAAVRAQDRRAEGQFRGYLAITLARQARLAEARDEIALGEQALRTLSDRLGLALLGCDRAETEWLAGDVAASRRAHALAAATADELACGEESELRRRLQSVAARFSV